MPRSTADVRMVQCPGCELKLPASDERAQVRHIEEHHPEIHERRLREAGFAKDENGGWVDLLAGPDS